MACWGLPISASNLVMVIFLNAIRIETTWSQNVVGIDLGSEYIKLAVVQRSAGVQIVLNEATKRKSPNALSFGDTQREFGDTAMVKPHLAITHTRELLGKSARAELTKIYGPHYFPFEIIPDEDRGAVKIKEGDRFLSPEVLVAMILTYAKSLAQAQTKEKVSDCVITVPAFWKQFERQALLDAAAIAGLNVLSLIHDHTAVALKYGTDNNVPELKEPQNVLFYDMGSTATKVSLVQFSSIPDKESFDKNKTLGQLKVLAVAWDETLGGNAFTTIVSNILKAKSKINPSENRRAMAKLQVTAEKTKVILSANKEAHPTIESFIDDYDYRASISRTEFEDQAKPLMPRVIKPIDDVLLAANMTLSGLHKVEMIGGGWRVPKIQEMILTHTKRSILDKTMNGDEAICFGAALHAASIDLEDGGGYSVDPAKDEVLDNDLLAPSADTNASVGSAKKNIKLFRSAQKLPAKRLLSFMRDRDLSFVLKYDGETVPGEPTFIARYNITGVAAALAKYPNASKHKIGVSFRLSRSGIVDVDKAEAALEQMIDIENCKPVAANSFSNASNSTSNTSSVSNSSETIPASASAAENAAGNESTQVTEGNRSHSDGNSAETDVVPKMMCTVEQVKRTFRVPLYVTADVASVRSLKATEIRANKAIVEGYEERENKIRERASAFNALESYIYVTKEKLETNEDLIAVTTAQFRSDFTDQLNKAGVWLEDAGWEADTATLQSKLAELTAVGDQAFWRMKEMLDRPEILKRVHEMLNVTDAALTNLTRDRPWLNRSFIEAVANKTQDLREWLNNVTAAQAAHPAHERPVFTRDDVIKRAQAVDTAMRELVHMRPPPPPPYRKPADKTRSAKDKKGFSGSGSSGGQTAESPAQEGPQPAEAPTDDANKGGSASKDNANKDDANKDTAAETDGATNKDDEANKDSSSKPPERGEDGTQGDKRKSKQELR